MNNLDDRLKAFFEHAEGPAEALPHPRRRRRTILALAAAALAIVAAAAVAVVVSRHGGSRSSVSSGGSCAALLTWRGHTYVGNRVAAAPEQGAPLEDGTTPPCNDVPGVTPVPAASARVTRLVGIDPRTAVGSADDPTIVWILAGRCTGFSQKDVLSCLREDLAFEGRRYVPTRLGQPLDQGQALGTGRLLDKSVEVRSLTGVPKETAVATDAEPGLVFLADGRCELWELVRLPSCLRGS